MSSFHRTDEEHSLIAQYTQMLSGEYNVPQSPHSPARIMAVIDIEHRDELDAIIGELEEENRYEYQHPTHLFA